MYIKSIAFIPGIYNSIVIKKKNNIIIIFYNYFFKIKFPVSLDKSTWSFDSEGNSVIAIKNEIINNWTLLMNQLHLKMFLLEGIFFEKLKFSGKGFKITFKRKKKYMKFMFGHSHMKVIFLKNTKIRRLTKYKYLIKDKNKDVLRHTSRLICNVRPLNIYTKRGLRKIRQTVFKRRGKKSTYI